MKLKFDRKDKIALVGGAVFVYTVGIIPTAVIGWTWFVFRKQIRDFLIKREVKEQLNKFKSYFNK